MNAQAESSPKKKPELKPTYLDVADHRRILDFLNSAIYPEDLVYLKEPQPNPDVDPIHEDNPEELRPKRTKLLEPDMAAAILEFRDKEYPLGFRHLNDLKRLEIFADRIWEILLHHFSSMFYGSWSVFPALQS